ncbi:MAG: glycosyltransferase family 4 protein [Anaerolineae bacterium]|nr:glycosyltransferase family 4 protein [Anaerolineae bacterium]
MAHPGSALCILITNTYLENWTGSELYVRDVAVELIKRGHKPVVYSPRLGKLAEELAKKSIPTIDNLESIHFTPDLIHGQHHMETMTALARFPQTPAVFVCHGWIPWQEIPPVHPRIFQYVTVSDALQDRLIYQYGIAPEKITTILNSVDLERFQPRLPLPDHPKRVLVFNNQIAEGNKLNLIRSVCLRNGLELDVVGYSVRSPSFSPEKDLSKSDIVFAVGRSALEGLAVGSAVICCSIDGVAQMVTMENLERLRRNNFGIRVLTRPFTEEVIVEEIQRYDPVEALKVSQKVRATAGLNGMMDQLLAVYSSVLRSASDTNPINPEADSRAISVYLKSISDQVYQNAAGNAYLTEKVSTLERETGEQIRILQAELNQIRGSFTWRLYQRAAAVPFLRGFYLRISSLFKKRAS